MMLTRENMLEDVHYQKVVPNYFIVEVARDNFSRNYQPLEGRVIQQWQIKLSECLATANSRLGRKEYVLAGRLVIEIRPGSDLKPHQARILSQIKPDAKSSNSHSAPVEARPSQPVVACLEQYPDGRRWLLYRGQMTLGRVNSCDIPLSMPEVLSHRLVSGQHAFLQVDSSGRVRLHDGSPNGRPSLNGTYVNQQRVYATGYELKDGDVITLAATDPANPRPDAPGVVTFRFHSNCSR